MEAVIPGVSAAAEPQEQGGQPTAAAPGGGAPAFQPLPTAASTEALRDCGVLYGMATSGNPWASSLSCTPVADNGTLLAGVVTFVDTRTGEVVEAPEPVEIIVTASDLQSLPINAGSVTIQPDTAHMLINQPLIAHTDAVTHTLSTVILGVPVDVRVTPLDYTWDFGNGEAPLVTTEPGGPYPDFTVSGAYTDLTTDNTVTLTTRWTGEFQVAGAGPWLPVSGTATTTATSRPFDIYEAPARLLNP